MRLPFAALGILLIGLTGCGTPSSNQSINALNRKLENQHSPFRYNSISLPGGASIQLELMPLPSGPTSASPQLKAEVEKAIGQAEAKARRSAEVKIKAVKPFENRDNVLTEVWLVEWSGRTFAYVVSLRPTADGVREFTLEGPTEI